MKHWNVILQNLWLSVTYWARIFKLINLGIQFLNWNIWAFKSQFEYNRHISKTAPVIIHQKSSFGKNLEGMHSKKKREGKSQKYV